MSVYLSGELVKPKRPLEPPTPHVRPVKRKAKKRRVFNPADYPLVSDVPIPPPIAGGSRRGLMRSPLTSLLLSMEVGQSFLFTEHSEFDKVRGTFTRFMDRRFMVRKMRDGWRVWRTT